MYKFFFFCIAFSTSGLQHFLLPVPGPFPDR
jgi:hypothetical protein